MDCNIHTLSDIYTEIETTVNEQLTLILQLQNNPEDLLKKHNLDKLELDVCSKFGALVVQHKSEDANIETEIKSLDSLLSSFIVDTKEKNWLHLNKKLQDCVLSTEEEMFRKGLQIHYKENLIELQDRSNSKYCENSPNAMVIDECSLLRHYLLLSLKYIGSINTGINERLLNNSKILTAPHQSIFIPRTSNALQKFLHSYKNSVHDHNWVSQAKKSFRISCNSKYKASIVLDLIEQVLKSLSTKSTWPSLDIVLYGLFPEDYYGITTVVQFGIHNNLLHPSMQNDGNLILLLKQSRTFLGYRSEEFIGFDWLVAVIFLMSSGKIEKCKQPLINISSLPIAPVIWSSIIHTSDKKQELVQIFYRQLEVILEENTKINIAFKSMDVSAKYIAEKWLNQCFFAILDFKELCNFISFVVLYPAEYVLYYLTAMFEHCRDDIFTALQTVHSVQVLKISQTFSFKIADYFNFMDKLHKRYKNCLHI